MTDNETIIIGSHNTMSYLRPLHWWAWPLRAFARCQRLTLLEQLDAGARAVDIRVYLGWDGQWHFAHGAVSFHTGSGILDYINVLPCGTYVRIILERSGEVPEKAFRALCVELEQKYPGLRFFGGYSKRPWRRLYTFRAEQGGELPLYQHCSSMAGDARWYERIIPVLYHRRTGHAAPSEGINLYDFF
ncbi:MAG: hypothetical protein NC311_09035 [Muribaculaceae bacterium]|nr:hypothetical protein [Muribaculaceae bacterium]